MIIFGSVLLITAGADIVAELHAADLVTAFFAAGLVVALDTLAGGAFVALELIFDLDLVTDFAFILKPFMPAGGWCIDVQEADPVVPVWHHWNGSANA